MADLIFEMRKPYGTKRYYPRNRAAAVIIVFKRAATDGKRKRTVKCLSAKEIKILGKIMKLVII